MTSGSQSFCEKLSLGICGAPETDFDCCDETGQGSPRFLTATGPHIYVYGPKGPPLIPSRLGKTCIARSLQDGSGSARGD
jgi:hypothetical protein